ncbi:hypothetical protein CLV49_1276 [Labedella gwakjiensis]|uniref:Uncharacterized protein n=1 Tax=Labedella gwakjiensis TaxID=390269 RepID=A0A2P8GUM5_9MICO|nr:hypothetical protein [Labedella gwakjiensis]PSL37669.1 hypothetical protein CLV49_1276 [Labedella gwakjiensis]RUQ87736.1 hypothetical protein ELQ93_12820 [Labedella gwakjiensis]
MTDARTSFPPLSVGTDAAAVKRSYRPLIGFCTALTVIVPGVAVVIAALVASTGGFTGGMLAGLGFVASGVIITLLTLSVASAYGSRVAMGTVLRLDDTGMEWRLPQGVLVVPWGAVTSVSERRRGGHRILTYRLVDGLTPSSPGVASDVAPAIFQRLVKRGLQLGSVGIDVPVDTILAATAAFTQGRVAPR